MFNFEDLQREIGQQNRGKWEELWNELLRADAVVAGLLTEDIDWDYRHSVGDGGRDITVKRGSQRGEQPLIPVVPSIWSVKSGADGPKLSTLKSEVTLDAHAAIRDLLKSGGKYIYCICYPANPNQRTKLDVQARQLEKDLAVQPNSIVICHTDHLVAHLKRQLGVVKNFCPVIDSSLGASLTQWGRQAKPVFDPTVKFIELEGRANVISEVTDHLASQEGWPLLHIAGLSGVGKTRLVYEACRRSPVAGSVLYYPSYAAVLPMLRRMQDDEQLRCILVVDECSLNDTTNLGSQLDAYANRVRAVSIGPAGATDKSREHILILPQPAEAGVLSILMSEAGGTVDDSILKVLAEHSAHDIRFALMLWHVVKNDHELASRPDRIPEALANPTYVFTRVLSLFQEQLGEPAAFLARYRWLTLARQVGFKLTGRGELEYLASVSNTAISDLDDLVMKSARCGLGDAPAHLFEAIPRGLATLIFSNELWPSIEPRFEAIYGDAPTDSFRLAIMQRVALCAAPIGKEVRSRVDRYFWSTLGKPDIAVLGDRSRSRIVRAWVELSPESGLPWLDRAIQTASVDTLREFKGSDGGLFGGTGPRRDVIWAVSHLACFGEFYDVCESILFRLALAENEKIGNNASAEWREKLRIILSNAETAYPQRMEILLGRLRSADATSGPLLLSGFIEAAEVPHSAMAPPAVIGGRLVPPEWRPTTNMYDLLVDAIRRGIACIANWSAELRNLAADQFIAKFDVLCKEDTLKDLRAFFAASVATVAQRVALLACLEESVAMHRRSDDADRQQLIDELSAWLEAMQPKTDEEAIQAIVQRPPWEYDRLAADDAAELDDKAWEPHYRKAAAMIARTPELLVRLEPWLEEQSPDSVTALGTVLGDHAEVQGLSRVLQDWVRTGSVSNLCAGFCNRFREAHGDLPAWVIAVLDDELARQPGYVARMSCAVDPSERGFERVMRCAQVVGANRAEVFGRLFGYHWNGVLTPAREAAVLAALRQVPEFTVEIEKAFVHLVRMYLHGDKHEKLPDALVPEVQFIVENPPTRAGGHASHEWKAFSLRLARTNPTAVLNASVKLAVNWRHANNFANGEAIEVLTTLASERPTEVLRSVLTALASEEHLHFVHLEKWQALFDHFEPADLDAQIEPLGIGFVRKLGRLVPDPSVKDGTVRVPRVTEWYLRKFGADDDCLRNFEIGRWSGRVRTGWAWQRTSEVERETQLYLRYPLPALQRWASMRLQRQMDDAERDRVLYEETNNRG